MAAFTLAYVPGVTPAKWARIWAERRPHEPLTLLQTDVSDQVAALRDGRADMSLVRLPIDRDGVHLISLYVEQPVVVVPKEHPVTEFDEVTLADLTGENLLELPDLTDEQLIEVVATGAGVALLPQSIARLYGRKDVKYRPVTDAEPTEVGLAWLADTESELTEELVGIVRGRTARSSRAVPTPPAEKTEKPKRPATAKPARKPAPKRAHRQSSGAPKPRKKRGR
jgi:DNA-binding transcriptional LysR family regulator